MKTLHTFRILSVLLLVFVTLASVRPASAASSHTTDLYTVDEYNLWPAAWNICGNIDLTVHDYGTLRIERWLDENNHIIKEHDIWGNYHVDFINNDKIVTVQLQGPTHISSVEYYDDHITEVSVTLGVDDIVTIPHMGRIAGGGGQFVETLTFDLNWNLIDDQVDKVVGNLIDDPTVMCTYLGS